MAKLKIKKGKSGIPILGKLSAVERVVVCIPVVVAIAAFGYICRDSGKPLNMSGISSTDFEAIEKQLSIAGEWAEFEDLNLHVWVPTTLTEEKFDGDVPERTERVFVDRNSANFPRRSVGIVVLDDIVGKINIESDPAGALEFIRPALNDSICDMLNGQAPSMMLDLNVEERDGEYIIVGEGDMEVLQLYQDPKDKEHYYPSLESTNVYYNTRVVEGVPVIVWGTWDHSTYKGRVDTTTSVKDIIASIVVKDDLMADEIIASP